MKIKKYYICLQKIQEKVKKKDFLLNEFEKKKQKNPTENGQRKKN